MCEKIEEVWWCMYSPRCAAVTSCSARRACSPAGHSTEYASWGQATICQIRPIGHVRCAVYSVFRWCGSRVSHACRSPGSDRVRVRFGMHFRKPPRSGAIATRKRAPSYGPQIYPRNLRLSPVTRDREFYVFRFQREKTPFVVSKS